VDRNELLAEAYKNLEWALFSKGKFEINRSIQRKVRYLTELYNIDPEDLLHDIFETFVSKKHYEKFNPAKGKLSTFMTHYANLSLLNIIKKHKRLNSNNKNISFPDDYEDTLSHLERFDFSDGLVEKKSPEELYLAKELYEKMAEFFEKDDLEVLQGDKTRREEAGRIGIDYDTYRKRLYRKRLDFQEELDNGE
jgi:DNA-directed RNA polymerase specialized sigma24 family protein